MLRGKDPTFSWRLWRWKMRAHSKDWCGLEAGTGKERESLGDPPEMCSVTLNFSPMRSTSDFWSVEYKIRKKCVGLSWWSIRLFFSCGHDLKVRRSSQVLGSVWSWESASDPLFASPPVPPPLKTSVSCQAKEFVVNYHSRNRNVLHQSWSFCLSTLTVNIYMFQPMAIILVRRGLSVRVK